MSESGGRRFPPAGMLFPKKEKGYKNNLTGFTRNGKASIFVPDTKKDCSLYVYSFYYLT